MSPEDTIALAKHVYFNEMMLQVIILKLYGSVGDEVIEICLKETEKEFKKAEKRVKKNG